jgi:hypothetical protein
MTLRSRFWLLFAFLLSVGLGLLLLGTLGSNHTPADWLVVSNPAFRVSTNAQGIHPMICLSVSNAGPRDLGFDLPWLECRTRSNPKLLDTSPVALAAARKPKTLPHGSVTNVFVEVSEHSAPDEACLFCCRIEWVEKESRLDLLARTADRPMYWLGALLGFNWNSPWRRKLAYGDVFASNVGVAPYFSRAYGFTRARWLDEQRLEQQRLDDVARRLSAMPAGTSLRYRTSRHGPATAEEQAADEAKSAFTVFCRTSTNVVPNPQLPAPPTDGPATPSDKPAGSDGGGVR